MELNVIWDAWCKQIDEHPFRTLLILFSIVLVYEGLTKNAWVETTIMFIVSFLIAMITAIALKMKFKVARGETKHVMDYRRPSAHALIATALATVASLLDLWLAPLMAILVIMTAEARIATGAHKRSEVVEGILYGLLIGIAIWILEKFL